MIYKSNNPSDTFKIAKKIASSFLQKGGVIALSGQLGAGKTTFTQGFAKSLGIKDRIISPTFVLIRQHQIPNQKRTLYHIDLYRLEDYKNIEELGIKELLNTKEDIVIIEWAEKIKKHLADTTTIINITNISKNKREILANSQAEKMQERSG